MTDTPDRLVPIVVSQTTADYIHARMREGVYKTEDEVVSALIGLAVTPAVQSDPVTEVPPRLAHRIRLLLDEIGRYTGTHSGRDLTATARNLATLLTRCPGYPESVWSDDPVATGDDFEQRLDRHEKAIGTMASWLVGAGGFGVQDARGIDRILKGGEL